jgi:IS30 family transposase
VDTLNNPSLPGRPLTPALQHLLQSCVALRTTNAKVLALHLNRSPHTIRTEFQRILSILNVHSRYSAVRAGEHAGWLQPDPTPRYASPALSAGHPRLLEARD